MIATKGHVVVIYLGFLQPKRSKEHVIFSYPSLKIALMRSRGATLSRCLHEICILVLPLCIPLSPSIPSPSGGLTLWIATQLRLGGNHHIIVAIDYFTKWEEAMPTIKYDDETTTHFIFNQIIT